MPRPKLGAAVTASVPCGISAKDIVAMDYWLNEAPMADPSRQNAICFALQRLLCEGAEVCLRDHPSRDGVEAVVNGSIALWLPIELAVWWRRVLVGHRAVPMVAPVDIPVDLLAPGVFASLADQVRRRAVHSWPPVEVRQANAA